ncbi:MAG: type I DNA topoisomerase [bacterium]
MAKSAHKSVLIVESPAKGKTIEGYLGKGYKVVASYGHVRDLPKSKLGIDVENNFEPQYMVPRGSAARIKTLKNAVKDADIVYLATDLDREGEAIAWHVAQILDLKPTQEMKRITFSEITKSALEYSVAHPREINQHLVDAQQARRVLDRLVGYSLSPVLWQKIRYGLSAGRVQSVALKIIMDREKLIEAFKVEEYWSLEAEFGATAGSFSTSLYEIAGKKVELGNEKSAIDIKSDIEKATFEISAIDQRPVKKSPAAPFTTSTLQQDAYRRMGYATRRTMSIAQRLYEAGLISYMRTDSIKLSDQAMAGVKKYLTDSLGKDYVLAKPRVHKSKARGAQEAHEAIRPTEPTRTPEDLVDRTEEEVKLYRLIWQRTIASQMPEARFLQSRIDVKASGKQDYILRATGRTMEFDGYQRVYPMLKADDGELLPKVEVGEVVKLEQLDATQHFTQPPARYSEATLVKALEAAGVGRPSTYAPTIATIQSRGYVLNEDKRLVPQEVGKIVNQLLTENFDFVTESDFTAKMEDKLDDIADGKIEWQPVVREYYEPMAKLIEDKREDIPRMPVPVIETDEVCDLCGKMMVIKSGRFGQFLACSGWPDCKNAKPILKLTGIECEKCHEGELTERKTKKGRRFWGCSRYPDCDYATWTKPKSPDEDLTKSEV